MVTEAELRAWGRRIGASAQVPLFLALTGPLGAGKSVLARAVARGAGVDGPLPSPTYNLLFRYPSSRGVEVVHIDLYRLKGPDELVELGWEELGGGREIVLVEWAERAGGLLPADRWDVELRIPEPGSERRGVRVERVGGAPELPELP